MPCLLLYIWFWSDWPKWWDCLCLAGVSSEEGPAEKGCWRIGLKVAWDIHTPGLTLPLQSGDSYYLRGTRACTPLLLHDISSLCEIYTWCSSVFGLLCPYWPIEAGCSLDSLFLSLFSLFFSLSFLSLSISRSLIIVLVWTQPDQTPCSVPHVARTLACLCICNPKVPCNCMH